MATTPYHGFYDGPLGPRLQKLYNCSMSFRVAMLTTGEWYGFSLAKELQKKGVALDTIILQTPSVRAHVLQRPANLKQWAWLPARTAIRASLFGLAAYQRRKIFTPYADHVVMGGALNSQRMQDCLRRSRAALVLLGGIGILSADTIAAAPGAILNAHPGLLPYCRGTGVVGVAIERGLPVGVTVHHVVPKIDGGAYVRRQLLPITSSDSLASLEDRADRLALTLLGDVAAQAVSKREVPQGISHDEHYKYCRWQDQNTRRHVEDAVASGRALQLYHKWRQQAGDRDVLPDNFVPLTHELQRWKRSA